MFPVCIHFSLYVFPTGAVLFFQHTLLTFSYQSVITFGGCRDDFIVVSSQQREPGVGKKSVEKQVFGMAKPKVDLCGYVLGLLSFIVQWFLNYGISTICGTFQEFLYVT